MSGDNSILDVEEKNTLKRCKTGNHECPESEFKRKLEHLLKKRCVHNLGDMCQCSNTCNNCYSRRKEYRKSKPKTTIKKIKRTTFTKEDETKRMCGDCKSILLVEEFLRISQKRSMFCDHSVYTECNCHKTCNKCNQKTRIKNNKRKRTK